MNNQLNQGRPIDYEAIINAKNKVNIGCKCNPQLKLELIREAKEYGLSVSEYIEAILSERNVVLSKVEEVSQLRKELKHYENERLHAIFQKHRGRSLPYKTQDGEQAEVFIESIKDIYTVIINIVKF